MLDRFADEGRTDVLTLGVTPVLAAMLDEPLSAPRAPRLARQLADPRGRAAHQRAGDSSGYGAALRELAGYEHRRATAALDDFERRWAHGGSPLLRRLADSGTVELLGGPATHPFQPLLDDRLVDFALRVGLDDRRLRLGSEPAGIWAPECGYRPGLEDRYAAAGVTHFLVDGPTLQASADAAAVGDAWKVGSSDVVAFGRDLEVTYRVWSPRAGYPGGRWYRDFHTFDHASGFRPARVTSRRTAPADKRAYEPAAALAETAKDAHDFVAAVVRRLLELRAATGRDEHRGRGLRHGAVRPLVARGTGLARAGAAAAARGRRADDDAARRDRRRRARRAGGPRLRIMGLRQGLAGVGRRCGRRHRRGQTRRCRSACSRSSTRRAAAVPAGPLPSTSSPARRCSPLSSDWAFCVTKDSAAGYARDRFATHRRRFDDLADLLAAGRSDAAERLAATFRALDGPFGHLDARLLSRRSR
jgi:1,4-alpha-glucan branching enzyme